MTPAHTIASPPLGMIISTTPAAWNARLSTVMRRALQRSLARPNASLEPIPIVAMTVTASVAAAGANPISPKCWRNCVKTPW